MPFAVDAQRGVAYVRYANPPRNFLTLAALDQLRRLIGRLERDRDLRVIVLTGVGDHYMLHLEVDGLRRLFDLSRAIPRPVHPLLRQLLRAALWTARRVPRAADVLFRSRGDRTLAMNALANVLALGDLLERSSKLTIAALNGPAVGGGLELSLGFDYRFGIDDDARVLGLPEVVIGLMPGFGGTARLPALIGEPAASALILSGELITPRAAHRLGLISSVVAPADFHRHLVDRAGRLASYPASAVAAIKRATRPPAGAIRKRQRVELAAVTALARDRGVQAALARYAELLDAELALPVHDQAPLSEMLERVRPHAPASA